jgi:hypothetical protein
MAQLVRSRLLICSFSALLALLLVVGCGRSSQESGSGDGDSSGDGDASGDGDGLSEGDLGPPTTSASGVTCNPGYTCSDDIDSDVIWVIKNDGNVNGPSCQDVCEGALDQNCAYHACEDGHPAAAKTAEDFAPIAEGLGFGCRAGDCWESQAPGEGMYLVSIGTAEDGTKTCYFPTEEQLSCDSHPGNANCFGERYATVCPCKTRPLDEACTWECGPHNTTRATFKTEAQAA